MKNKDEKKRCSWVSGDLMTVHHDNEYGRIQTDDNAIFAKFCLEIFTQQKTYAEVLERQDQIRDWFFQFDIGRCANMDDTRLDSFIQESGLQKQIVYAVRTNAICCQEIIADYGSLFKFVYGFKQPEKLYKALLKYGFQEIQESNVLWLMKNIGVIEAHEPDCFLKSSHPEGTH